MRTGCLGFIAAAIVTFSLFNAMASAGTPQSGKEAFSKQDLEFINHAWNISATEIQLGHLAEKNAANADVKEFGTLMSKQHMKMNESLAALIRERDVSLPNAIDKEHQELVDRLSKLSGADFDREYMTAMIKGHQKAAAKFEKEANDPAQTRVGQWAAQGLPEIKEHLEMAMKTGKEVGAIIPEDAAASTVDHPDGTNGK